METETLRSKRARRASKVATAAAKHDKAISFQPERSEDTAQIDDVELETNSNVQSAQPSRGGYATYGAQQRGAESLSDSPSSDTEVHEQPLGGMRLNEQSEPSCSYYNSRQDYTDEVEHGTVAIVDNCHRERTTGLQFSSVAASNKRQYRDELQREIQRLENEIARMTSLSPENNPESQPVAAILSQQDTGGSNEGSKIAEPRNRKRRQLRFRYHDNDQQVNSSDARPVKFTRRDDRSRVGPDLSRKRYRRDHSI